MSRANLPPLGIVLTVDDSAALSSLRGAYAKLQAEVESRGLKVPLTVSDAGGGRGATFGTPGVAPTLTSTAGFQVNRPVAPGAGFGFNIAPTAAPFNVAQPGAQFLQGTPQQGIAALQNAFAQMQTQAAAQVAATAGEGPEGVAAASVARRRGGFGPGRRILAYGLIAAREIQRSSYALDEGERDAMFATTQADELRARIKEQRSAWGGFAASAGGFALDLFGAGPESFTASASRTLSLVESQDKLRAQQVSAGFAAQDRAAMTSGDTIERRRIQVRRSLSGVEETNLPQIRQIRSELGQTKEEFQSFGSSGEINTRTVPKVQGQDRSTLQNKLRELQGQLDNAAADAASEIDQIIKDVDRTRREMRTGTRAAGLRRRGYGAAADVVEAFGQGTETILAAPPELRQEAMQAATEGTLGAIGGLIGRGFGYVRDIGGAMIRARAQGRRQSILNAERTGGAFGGRMAEIDVEQQEQIEANRALPVLQRVPESQIRATSDAQRALERSGLERQRKIMDIRLEAQGRALDQIKDHNPIGARSTEGAAEAIASAAGLVGPQYRPERKQILQNALKEQEEIRQQYGESFRAVQFDTRTSSFNPRDQEDSSKVLHSINENIMKLLDKLTVEQ